MLVFTGAGISAESGIRTFRDADGLWENHAIEDVATPGAWVRNPGLVLRFYNERRRQVLTAEPNDGHRALVELERYFDVDIVTQNVDDLHERAGSKKVMHLHGELRKVRSVTRPNYIIQHDGDIHLGDLAPDGGQLRPHIVWFGESVPMLDPASELATKADYFLIVGTSLQVYPAASLMLYSSPDIPYYYVDPKPQINWELAQMTNLTVFAENASTGLPKILDLLTNNQSK